MKTLFPILILTAALCGCPDTKVPKAPPLTPQPKAVISEAGAGGLTGVANRHIRSPARA
jgi:hypothetical protein